MGAILLSTCWAFWWPDHLNVGVDSRWQSVPLTADEQRVTVSRPVEPVLIHPIAAAAEEVSVEYVMDRCSISRTNFAQPIEDYVETSLHARPVIRDHDNMTIGKEEDLVQYCPPT